MMTQRELLIMGNVAMMQQKIVNADDKMALAPFAGRIS